MITPTILQYHVIISLIIGYFLDLIFGDPRGLYHFVEFEGKLINIFENLLNKKANNKIFSLFTGIILWIVSISIPFIIMYFLIYLGYSLNTYIGLLIEIFFVYQCLATHSLKEESMKVHIALLNKDIVTARVKLSYIVGRDCENLDEDDIIKADIETIAENTCDGVISPLFYIALFGVYGGILSKLVNTLDSMVGYRNDRYKYFGTFSARVDDVIQFIPARITAFLMLIASIILKYDTKNGIKIFRRDRFKHSSINSAQSEAVVAGVLDIQLAGNASYGGIIKIKPFIGDPLKSIDKNDIIRANRILYMTSIIAFLIILLILFGV